MGVQAETFFQVEHIDDTGKDLSRLQGALNTFAEGHVGLLSVEVIPVSSIEFGIRALLDDKSMVEVERILDALSRFIIGFVHDAPSSQAAQELETYLQMA